MSDEQEGQPGLPETGLSPEQVEAIAAIVGAPVLDECDIEQVEPVKDAFDKPGIREADARRARGFRRGIVDRETR